MNDPLSKLTKLSRWPGNNFYQELSLANHYLKFLYGKIKNEFFSWLAQNEKWSFRKNVRIDLNLNDGKSNKFGTRKFKNVHGHFRYINIYHPCILYSNDIFHDIIHIIIITSIPYLFLHPRKLFHYWILVFSSEHMIVW